MKIYILSPDGVPLNQWLFPKMDTPFLAHGHDFVPNRSEADVCFIDLHSRRFDYRQVDVDWLLKSNIPFCVWDEWDRGNLSSDEWPWPLTKQQDEIFEHIVKYKIKDVHFCRLLDKSKSYPPNLYPYEKPFSYQEPLLTPEQLFNRPYDVAFIANHAPSRERIAKELQSDSRLKCIIRLGEPKIEFDTFLNVHRIAKLFISSGAGGFTDERKQCLFSIAGLIQEEHNQLLLHPFTNLENCIKINNPPTKEDIDTIVEVCNDKEKLYSIYKNNYDFMTKYYSEQYMAENVLRVLKENGIE